MTDIFQLMDHDSEVQPRHNRGRKPRRTLPRPLKVLLAILIPTVTIAAVAAAAVGIYATHLAITFDSNRKHIDNAFPDDRTRPAPHSLGAKNILILGSDSRGDATNVDDSAATNQRTDSMMLVHISADRQDVYVMSIMRDLWVPVPGRGTTKINAAFAYGGSPLTVHTIESLLGIRIDHVAIIDFEGFKAMTDALGGVTVTSEKAFTAGSFSFSRGANHLNGTKALAFVRERYAFEDSDFQRVKNQQAFLKGVVSAVLNQSTLTNPGTISSFVGAVSQHLSLDRSFDLSAIISLSLSVKDITQSHIHFFSAPTAGVDTSADGQSIVKLDEAAAKKLRVALQEDTVSSYLRAH